MLKHIAKLTPLVLNSQDVFNTNSIGRFEFADGSSRWRTRSAIISGKSANDEEANAWRIAA